jgi:hypothetical protein
MVTQLTVHTGCQFSRALKYKTRVRQQMDGGIDINYGCKDFILLLGWMDVGMETIIGYIRSKHGSPLKLSCYAVLTQPLLGNS